MKIKEYLKENILNIIIYSATTILISIILYIFKLPICLLILIGVIFLITGAIILYINYNKKAQFYNELLNNLNKLDQKYLIIETLKEPTSLEEKIFYNSLHEINKSMIEKINEYKNDIYNFKEYLELWIHEVKLPISSLTLKVHNNKEKYDKDLGTIVRKIDNSIDEILYYFRMENTEKDFSIKETSLKGIVKNIILKNKDDLLENEVEIKANVEETSIATDKKWLEFIINQIINNSIKYKKNYNSYIEIKSLQENNKTILSIKDNGIGIPKKDLNRVFDKSFTGSNGRNKVKSTGMGLYIIKNLCDKLGHTIKINSVEKEYTEVIIEFGNNDLYNITKK